MKMRQAKPGIERLEDRCVASTTTLTVTVIQPDETTTSYTNTINDPDMMQQSTYVSDYSTWEMDLTSFVGATNSLYSGNMSIEDWTTTMNTAIGSTSGSGSATDVFESYSTAFGVNPADWYQMPQVPTSNPTSQTTFAGAHAEAMDYLNLLKNKSNRVKEIADDINNSPWTGGVKALYYASEVKQIKIDVVAAGLRLKDIKDKFGANAIKP